MNLTGKIKTCLKRRPDSHKGDYGRVFILAGSRGMSGACVLSAYAALRSGAGLVTVGVPRSLISDLTRAFREPMFKAFPETKFGTLSKKSFSEISKFLATQDVFAVGPGISRSSETQTLIRKLVLFSTKPMVIDADGLNAFSGRAELFRKIQAPAILTPHPGEFTLLFGGKIPKGDSERKKCAMQIAKKYKVIIVLKGHRTIVASPSGEVYVNRTGNPGMATGGAGDVLTGVIAAMLGQGIKPFNAACFGVYLHGFAGDFAAKKESQISLIAGDIIETLPLAFKRLGL